MRKLFGIDFPAVLDQAFQSASPDVAGVPIQSTGYGTVTLVKNTATTRNPTQQTAGLQPTQTSYPGIRANVSDMPLPFAARPLGAIGVEPGDQKVKIWSDSLPKGADGEPSVVPEIDDQITIGGRTRTIYFVKRGTSGASFKCYVR